MNFRQASQFGAVIISAGKKQGINCVYYIWRHCICFNLGITITTIGAMLADDGRLWLFELEISRHHMEQERFTPLYDAGHLIKRHRQTLNDGLEHQ